MRNYIAVKSGSGGAGGVGVKAKFASDAATVAFPPIDVTRIRAEFSFHPIPFAQSFGKLLSAATTEPA